MVLCVVIQKYSNLYFLICIVTGNVIQCTQDGVGEHLIDTLTENKGL